MSLNDYIVDKIFKDYVEIAGVSQAILSEDNSVIKDIFKKGVSTEKNKNILCVLLCSLAYADPGTFYSTLNSWNQNLMNFKMYSSRCQLITYCTYSFKDTIVIAFKGSSSIKDFFYNINTTLITTEDIKGKIHKGFYELLAKGNTVDKLSNLIENYPDETKVVFTGHSLGGALASLMASYCQNKFGSDKISLVTFGSPRVGNYNFSTTITNSNRIINDKDPVSLLPFPPRYTHLSPRQLLGDSGVFHGFTLNAHKISMYYDLLSET